MILKLSVNFIISGSEFKCFNKRSYQANFKNYHFWSYYCKTKTEEYNQRNLNFYAVFAMLISWTTTGFLDVSALVSSKVATNGSFRGKRISKISFFEAIILNQKWSNGKKIIYFSIVILKLTGSAFTHYSEISSKKLLWS